MRRVIFLDIDGVLAPQFTCQIAPPTPGVSYDGRYADYFASSSRRGRLGGTRQLALAPRETPMTFEGPR